MMGSILCIKPEKKVQKEFCEFCLLALLLIPEDWSACSWNTWRAMLRHCRSLGALKMADTVSDHDRTLF